MAAQPSTAVPGRLRMGKRSSATAPAQMLTDQGASHDDPAHATGTLSHRNLTYHIEAVACTAHHWLVSAPDMEHGSRLHTGVCRKCNARRTFDAYAEGPAKWGDSTYTEQHRINAGEAVKRNAKAKTHTSGASTAQPAMAGERPADLDEGSRPRSPLVQVALEATPRHGAGTAARKGKFYQSLKAVSP